MPRRIARPAHIDPELFRRFRSPRRGSANPEDMTNPLWVWISEQDIDAYLANATFGGPPSTDAGPCWSSSRFGRTETLLPDGRLIRIGGEYEDYYDADFYIYNDVIVRGADGRTEIFGYPEDVFPPTDFHTADLAGDRIIVIGNLSYPHLRQQKAQVLTLDTTHYAVSQIEATGEHPPWLYKHSSKLAEDGRAIIVHGGEIHVPGAPVLLENIDDWRLELGSYRWVRLTHRAWPRFVFVRADGKGNHLFWLRDLRDSRKRSRPEQENFAKLREERLADLGPQPRLDVIDILYVPGVPHAKMPEREGEYGVYRVDVDGITVRYIESEYGIVLTIEGTLPKQTVELLCADLQEKLAAAESTSIDCNPILVD